MCSCKNVEIFFKKSQCFPKKTIENFKLVKKPQKSLFDDHHRYRSSYLVQSSFHDRSSQTVNSQLIISDDYYILKHTALCFLQIIGFLFFIIILFKKNDLKKEDEKPLKKRRIVSMGPLTNTNLEFLMPEQQIIGFDINMYC